MANIDNDMRRVSIMPMRSLLLLGILAAAFQLAPLKGNAASASAPATTGTTAASGGVTLSLSTSGYQFTPLVSATNSGGVVPAVVPIVPKDQGFSAAVALTNLTGQAIKLQLGVIGGSSSSPSFEFSIYNAAGTLVWDNLGNVSIPLIYLATLKSGDALRGNVFVPLFPNGTPLPAGTYTLEVSLYGTPAFSATTSFVVNKAAALK